MSDTIKSDDLYIILFHGRAHPDMDMDDWGTDGPIIGPFPFAHHTYLSHIKLGDGKSLERVADTIYYNHRFYGDYSVVSGAHLLDSDAELTKRIEPYNATKADPDVLRALEYKIERTPEGVSAMEKHENVELDPRLDLVNHSSTGFEYGYAGSGPAQLALAIMAHYLRCDKDALCYYQSFKHDMIEGRQGDGFVITARQIFDWLGEKK